MRKIITSSTDIPLDVKINTIDDVLCISLGSSNLSSIINILKNLGSDNNFNKEDLSEIGSNDTLVFLENIHSGLKHIRQADDQANDYFDHIRSIDCRLNNYLTYHKFDIKCFLNDNILYIGRRYIDKRGDEYLEFAENIFSEIKTIIGNNGFPSMGRRQLVNLTVDIGYVENDKQGTHVIFEICKVI